MLDEVTKPFELHFLVSSSIKGQGTPSQLQLHLFHWGEWESYSAQPTVDAQLVLRPFICI
jgi:hypothetical protein